MRIYLVQSPNETWNRCNGYVCYARSPEEALAFAPDKVKEWDEDGVGEVSDEWWDSDIKMDYKDKARVTHIGESEETQTEPRIILASFTGD